MKYQSHGVEKDILVKEIYPFEENGFIPLDPLIVVDCQDENFQDDSTIIHLFKLFP